MAFFRGDVYSYALGKMTPLAVYLPYDDNRRFGVKKPLRTLVLLHGIGGNYSYWSRFSSVERYAQQHNLALVMPDGELSLYADNLCGQNYATYIGEELKEILSHLFCIPTDRERYFIGGLSMGGYGALKLALRYPDQFGRCASFSGALTIGTQEQLTAISGWKYAGKPEEYEEEFELHRELYQGYLGAYGEQLTYRESEDLLFLARKAVERGEKLPRLLLTCGTEDFLYETNLEYCKLLDRLGISYEFHEWSGEHMWKFWDESMRDYISFFDD